jgi:hypothetical protein
MYLIDSSSVLNHCTIARNTAAEDGGGILSFRGAVSIQDCQILNNVSGERGGGLHTVGGHNRISETVITDNVALAGGGGVSGYSLSKLGDSTLEVISCRIENNFSATLGGGAWIWSTEPEPRTAQFQDSVICGNVPDEFAGPADISGDSIVCSDCNFNGIPDEADIALNPTLDCNLNLLIDSCEILSGSTPDRNGDGTPDSCEEATLFVPSEYTSIGSAIQAANPGDVVWIAPGTYSETINASGKAITIRGGGDGVIIDGTSLTDSLFIAKSGEGPGTVIDGLTFRNGRVGSTLVTVPTLRVGGGAYIENASPTIRNCTFEQCRAQYGGGGYFYGFNGLVDSCVFRSNTAFEDGGGLLVFDRETDGRAVVINSLFESNICGKDGGALHLVSVVGHVLQDCIIRQNQAQLRFGGGISWYRYGPIPSVPDPLVVDGCAIEENIAGASGGGIYVHTLEVAATIRDSVVCQNLPNNLTGSTFDDGGNNFCNCLGDLSRDGVVNGADLGILLGQWGVSTTADLNNDGLVTGADIGLLLGAWGTCP